VFAYSRAPHRDQTQGRSVSAAGLVWASVMIGGVLVWAPSSAAFSPTAGSSTYDSAADGVSLSGTDNSTALFTVSRLKPESAGSRCIVVTSTGSVASAIRLYATGYSTTKALGSYIDLVVDEGVGVVAATSGPTSCTGFTARNHAFRGTLAAFVSTKTSFANGVGSWAQTGSGSSSRTFRFSYSLDAATPNSAQSGTAATELTWEQQNS
jgi:hypothetical protein